MQFQAVIGKVDVILFAIFLICLKKKKSRVFIINFYRFFIHILLKMKRKT